MPKGTLGIIICPMNDDHLIHSLSSDHDIGRIVLLDNEYSKSVGKKSPRGV